MTTRENIAKVSKLDNIIVQYPEFEYALEGIQECVLKSEFYKEPVGCILSAEGGMGKTTICRTIMAGMSGRMKNLKTYEATIIPAFYAEVPSPATVKSVAASMLTQLKDPNPLIGNTSQLTARLCTLLGHCETKLVFLDELHNLLDVSNSKTKINTNVCNWIKSIVNTTSVSICLVGLPEFAPILYIDSQLSRRFPLHFKLEKLTIGTVDSPGTLSPFLQALANQAEDILGLKSVHNFSNYHAAYQMYAATSGNPSFIMALIKESALITLNQNRDNLDINSLALAWQTGITAKASLTPNNPFDMSLGMLANIIPIGRRLPE